MNRRYQRLSLSRVSPLNQSKSNQLNLTRYRSNQINQGEGENRRTRRKTSQSRVENQQTQPTYDAKSGNRTRATLVGGECSTTVPTLLSCVVRVHDCMLKKPYIYCYCTTMIAAVCLRETN